MYCTHCNLYIYNFYHSLTAASFRAFFSDFLRPVFGWGSSIRPQSTANFLRKQCSVSKNGHANLSIISWKYSDSEGLRNNRSESHPHHCAYLVNYICDTGSEHRQSGILIKSVGEVVCYTRHALQGVKCVSLNNDTFIPG